MNEIKKFVRLNDNRIYDTSKLAYYNYEDGKHYQVNYDYSHRDGHYDITDIIVKLANTPQELIEVGDLIVDSEYGYPFRADQVFKDNIVNDIEGWIIPFNEITKILTPNSNGGYDLQWSADNDKR